MVIFADDFRGHVSWGPTGIFCVVRLHLPGDAQIGYPQIPPIIEHKVFRLEVAVDDPAGVEVLESSDNAGEEETGLLLSEFTTIAQVVPEVTPVAVIHNQEKSLSCLEG